MWLVRVPTTSEYVHRTEKLYSSGTIP
eukprot:SAG31_NODE_29859_length_388_cov_4.671280_1_plen_26_part_01